MILNCLFILRWHQAIALATLLIIILLKPGTATRQVCTLQPLGVTENATFIVDVEAVHLQDLKADDVGSWHPTGTKKTYFRFSPSGALRISENQPPGIHADYYVLTRRYYIHNSYISFTGRLLISEVNIVYWIITWLNSLACWVMWSHFNWRTCISAYLCFKFTLAHLVVQLGSFTFIYLSYIFNNGWTDWYPGQYTCIGQHAHIKVFPVWRWNKKSKLQATSYIMESARFVFVKVHTSAHNVGKSS